MDNKEFKLDDLLSNIPIRNPVEFKLLVGEKTMESLKSFCFLLSEKEKIKSILPKKNKRYFEIFYPKIKITEITLFSRGSLYKVRYSYDWTFRFKFYYGTKLIFISESLIDIKRLLEFKDVKKYYL